MENIEPSFASNNPAAETRPKPLQLAFSAFRSRLCRKVVLTVFAAIVAIELMILVPSYFRQKQQHYDQLTEIAQASVFAATSDAVHFLERAAAYDPQELFSNDRLIGVAIVEDGRTKLVRGISPAINILLLKANGIFHQRTRNGLALDIGWSPEWSDGIKREIFVRLDARHIPEEMRGFLLQIAALILLISILVTAMTILVLWPMVLRPLLELTRKITTHDGTEDTTRLEGANFNRIDEIGDLYREFKFMVERLAQSINETTQARDALEFQVAERTAELEDLNQKLADQNTIARRAEQRFRSFTQSAADWYWEMDRELRFSYFSERFFNVTGVLPEQLLGKTRRETSVSGIDPQVWESHLASLEAHRPFRNFIHSRQRNDGTIIWVSINGQPVYDSEGAFQGYRGTGSDITERRAADLEIEKRTKNLSALNDILRLSLADNSVEEKFHASIARLVSLPWLAPSPKGGVLMFASNGALQPVTSVGFEKVEKPAISDTGFLERLRANATSGAAVQHVSTDTAESESYYSVRFSLDGTALGILVLFLAAGHQPKESESTYLNNIASIFSGMVEKDRAERELEVGEKRLRQILHSSPIAINIANSEDQIVFANSEMASLLGQSSENLLNHKVTDYFASTEEHRQVLSEILLNGGLRNREALLKRADGSTFCALISVEPEPFDDTQYISWIFDITELKNAQHEAETASRTKTDFLSSMSHELRTPLNAILGFSQMLGFNPREPLSEAQKECVGHISRSGSHLLELIDQILDLTRIELGKVDLSISDISPADVLDDCLPLISQMAEDHAIEVVLPEDLDHIQYRVHADATRLKQILLNLMSNGIKYNREGGRLSIEFEPAPSGRLRISVKDTGNGIADDMRDELFKPFSRLGAESSAVEGTGIGLVVCKNLVALMDGEIGVESEVGKGSTFWIELPMVSSDTDEASDETGGSTDATTLATRGLTGTLLCIEDNPNNLRLLELITSQVEGLAMISAHTAELGIELAKSQQPDIIVLDINLPGMNGIEAVQALKLDPQTLHIPVVALSAAATEADIETGMAAGFMRYLTKPIQIQEFLDAVSSALGRSI